MKGLRSFVTSSQRTLGRAEGAVDQLLPRRGPRRAQTGRARDGRPSRVPFALLVTGLIAGGLAALLGLNTLSAANELRRHTYADRDTAIAAQLQQLHDEVAADAAPANLARAAEALGMVPAGNPAFLVIGPDGTVRVLGSPAPAAAPPLPVPPKPKPKPKPKPTQHAKKKTDKKATDKKTKTNKKTAGHTTTPAKKTPSPTPTVTLPGGNR